MKEGRKEGQGKFLKEGRERKTDEGKKESIGKEQMKERRKEGRERNTDEGRKEGKGTLMKEGRKVRRGRTLKRHSRNKINGLVEWRQSGL